MVGHVKLPTTKSELVYWTQKVLVGVQFPAFNRFLSCEVEKKVEYVLWLDRSSINQYILLQNCYSFQSFGFDNDLIVKWVW